MASAAPMSAVILGQGVGEPADELFLVTPSDSVDLRFVTRCIRVGGAGDLAVLTIRNTLVTIPSVLAGEYVTVRARKVYSTNTTATEIMGMA